MNQAQQIFDRLAAICDGLGVTVFRNVLDIPEESCPAIVVTIGEEHLDKGFNFNRRQVRREIIDFVPEVFILLQEDQATIGATLNDLRLRLIRDVLNDATLRGLCLDGRVRYDAFQPEFLEGRKAQVIATIRFVFRYILRPEEPPAPSSVEVISSEAPSSSAAPSSEAPSSSAAPSSEAASSSAAPSSEAASSSAAEAASSSAAPSSEVTSSDELEADSSSAAREAKSSDDAASSDKLAHDAKSSDDAASSDKLLHDAKSSDDALSSDKALHDAKSSDDAASSDKLAHDAKSSDDAASSDKLAHDAKSSDDAASSDKLLHDAKSSDDAASSDKLAHDHKSSDDAASSDKLAHDHKSSDDAASSDKLLHDAHSSDQALSSDQHSDVSAAEAASSSDYVANLRPFFVNKGAVSSNPVSSNNNTPALPSGLVQGNLLIAFQSNANGHPITVSAGWTLFDLEPTGGSNIGAMAYRYVDGSETAPVFSWTGGATANAGVVTQWGHVAHVNPIGALTQTNSFSQVGNQSLSLTNNRGFSRIIAFSMSPTATDFTTPATWEDDVTRGAPPNVGLKVDSKGVDSATYTQAGQGSSTESHLIVFELYGPFTEAQSSDRAASDRYLSDRFLSDRNLSDRNLSDRFLSDRNLSDRNLSDRNLSDRFLSDRNLSDRFLSDRNLSDKHLADAASSDKILHDAISSDTVPPSFVRVGTVSSSAGATSLTPVLPSVSGGNFLIAVVETTNNKTISLSGSGWTILTRQPSTAGSQGLAIAYRYVDGSQGNPTFSWTGSAACVAFVMLYTGVTGAQGNNPWGDLQQTTVTGNALLTATPQQHKSTIIAFSGSPSVVNYTTANSPSFTQRVHSNIASRPGAEVDDISSEVAVNYQQAGVGAGVTSNCVTAELKSH